MNPTTTRRSMAGENGHSLSDEADHSDNNHKIAIDDFHKNRDTYSQCDCTGVSHNHGEGPSSNRPMPNSFLYAVDDIVRDIDNIPQFLLERKSTLRFPETLLLLLVQAEREVTKHGGRPEQACIAWMPNGLAIVIRNKEELIHICKSKFSSFTRKLYRWGFRQVIDNKAIPKKKAMKGRAEEVVFRHPLFQRDDKPLMEGMKSVTAEGTKRAFALQKHKKCSYPEVGAGDAGSRKSTNDMTMVDYWKQQHEVSNNDDHSSNHCCQLTGQMANQPTPFSALLHMRLLVAQSQTTTGTAHLWPSTHTPHVQVHDPRVVQLGESPIDLLSRQAALLAMQRDFDEALPYGGLGLLPSPHIASFAGSHPMFPWHLG